MRETKRRETPTSELLSRRRLLGLTGGAIAGIALAPIPALAAIPSRPDRNLHLHLAHTGETFTGTYWSQGRYVPDALQRINELLRDQHTDAITHIDPRLLDLLSTLQHQLGVRQPFEVVCGYRSAETNEMLREEGMRAAKHSLHITGQAVDVRLRERSVRQLYDAARSLRAGGVGYYGHAQFVHLDVGEVRHWEVGGSRISRPRSHSHHTRRS